ncbi:MAG: cyclic pyranopterin monophosphate synthase MoaC [bacterium]|nr:cyclic pyranopterin monophosphate synthase MoaC [bacterium]
MPFNHFDDDGKAHMVDVGHKEITRREATAAARVVLGPELLARVTDHELRKGDVLGVARLSGIAATKRTPDLIPLSHPLALVHAAVEYEVDAEAGAVTAVCTVVACDRTGVEMEAMTGATVAALTIYDMCKGEHRGITIGPVKLRAKSGGRSGTYMAPED